MKLATREPYVWHEFDQPAYTYALIHLPSGRVYVHYTTDPRKSYNMWAHRLRNPDGNSKVPKAFRTFAWSPDQWRFDMGNAYETEALARNAHVTARVALAGKGRVVLNSTVHTMSRRIAKVLPPKTGKFIERPEIVPAAAMSMPWPEFLTWLMTGPPNFLGKSPNPTDEQVRQAWFIWHEIHGTTATLPVPDPDRSARHVKAAANRRYQRTWRAKQKAFKPIDMSRDHVWVATNNYDGRWVKK
jgi:hypothetical protein